MKCVYRFCLFGFITHVTAFALVAADAPTEAEIQATADRLESVSVGVDAKVGEVGQRLDAVQRWSREAAGKVVARVGAINADAIDDNVQECSAKQAAKKTTLRRARAALQAKDESLRATRSQSSKEHQALDDEIAMASQQIEVLDNVIEELAPAPHDGSGAAAELSAATASVLGVLKGIADGVRQENTELTAKQQESAQHFQQVQDNLQDELAVAEQAYRTVSQEYTMDTASLQSVRDLSGLARKLDGSTRDSYGEVSLFNSNVTVSMEDLPGIAQGVYGDVIHGKELIDRIAARRGQSEAAPSEPSSEAASPANFVVSPSRAGGKFSSSERLHRVLMTNSSATMLRRLINPSHSGSKLFRLSNQKNDSGLRHTATLAATAFRSSKRRYLASRAVTSSDRTFPSIAHTLQTPTVGHTGILWFHGQRLDGQVASQAASVVIRRGAVRFHSAALQRLASTVAEMSISDSMGVLHELGGALKKRNDDSSGNATNARHECESRRMSALAEKRRARERRHEIVLENATTFGTSVSIKSRFALLSEQEEWEQGLANETTGLALNATRPAFDAERASLDQVTQDVERWASSNTISAGELEGLRVSLQGAKAALDRASEDLGAELGSTQSGLDSLEARWREGSSRSRGDLQELEEEQQEVEAKLERLRTADESARTDEESADADIQAAEQVCTATAFVAASRAQRGSSELALVRLALNILDSAESSRTAP